jgi:hypothetical protein
MGAIILRFGSIMLTSTQAFFCLAAACCSPDHAGVGDEVPQQQHCINFVSFLISGAQTPPFNFVSSGILLAGKVAQSRRTPAPLS